MSDAVQRLIETDATLINEQRETIHGLQAIIAGYQDALDGLSAVSGDHDTAPIVRLVAMAYVLLYHEADGTLPTAERLADHLGLPLDRIAPIMRQITTGVSRAQTAAPHS